MEVKMTMTKDSAAFKEVSILLRSLITPYNKDGGILLSKLYEEYKEEQEELPFRALGYSSITALLDAVENVNLVYKNDDWYATTTPNPKTAHIHELIANQKTSNKNKVPHSQSTNAETMPSNSTSDTQSEFSSAPSSPYRCNRSRSQSSYHDRSNARKMPFKPTSDTQSGFSPASSSPYRCNRSRSQPSYDHSSYGQSAAGKMPYTSSDIQSRSSSARALLIPLITSNTNHDGINLSKLFWKYNETAPNSLTYQALGYKSFTELLRNVIDNVQIIRNIVSLQSNSELSRKRKIEQPSNSRSGQQKTPSPSPPTPPSNSSSTTTSSSSSSLYNRSSSSRPAQSSYDRPRGNYNGSITTTPPSYGRSYSYSSVQQKTPSPPTVTKTPLSQRKVHVYLPESAKKSEPTTPPSNTSSTKSDTEFRKPDVPSLSSSRSRHSSSNENSSRTRVSSSSPSNRNKIPIILKEKEQILPPLPPSPPSPPSPPRKVAKGSQS